MKIKFINNKGKYIIDKKSKIIQKSIIKDGEKGENEQNVQNEESFI